MKYILIILLSTFLLSCGNTIGTPIIIDDLEIAENDFPDKMNFDEAEKACAELGDEWRLPTREELNFLFQNKNSIGGFDEGTYDIYCSSTKDQDGYTFCQSRDGQSIQNDVITAWKFRAVRGTYSNSKRNTKMIGTPIKLGKLEISENDFPDRMNWEEAKKACAELGDEWRLPTREELNFLFQNKNSIGGFTDNYYWSSTEEDEEYAYHKSFSLGISHTSKKILNYNIRAVRGN
jgi:hypothetical protein